MSEHYWALPLWVLGPLIEACEGGVGGVAKSSFLPKGQASGETGRSTGANVVISVCRADRGGGSVSQAQSVMHPGVYGGARHWAGPGPSSSAEEERSTLEAAEHGG